MQSSNNTANTSLGEIHLLSAMGSESMMLCGREMDQMLAFQILTHMVHMEKTSLNRVEGKPISLSASISRGEPLGHEASTELT